VRLVRRVIGWQKLIVFRMTAESPTVTHGHEVIEIIDSGDLGEFCPWDAREVRARLELGSLLYALRVEGRLVSYAWVTELTAFRVNELRRELRLDQPLVWIWDCVTPEQYRGRGYYPVLIGCLAGVVGRERALIFVRTDNVPSVRGIEKAGFRPWLEIAATRWSVQIRELGRFEGKLSVSPRGD
jgi:hypothetical protein